MADLFRIVTIGTDGRARVLEDLQVADVLYRERDTLAVTPGAGRPSMAASSARYAGAIATREVRDNGGIAATLVVKGPTPADAATTVERLLERVSTARRDLFIEWRPDGLTFSAYSRIMGPGTSAPAYRWIEWKGGNRLAVPVAWPVEPLARGLPCAIYERFAPPADKPAGLVNLIPDPNAGDTNSVWPPSFPGAAITSSDAAVDLELGGPGRARYLSATGGNGLAGTRAILDATATTNTVRTPVTPGGYYAIRGRLKVRTAWTAVAAAPFRLVARFSTVTGGSSTIVVASSPLNAGAHVVGDVIDFAGVVQAPATASVCVLGIEVDPTAAGAPAGAVRFGMFMVARVSSPSSSVPAYADGEGPSHRFTGAPFLSPSVELTEPKLADYGIRPGGAASVERVMSGSLYQRFTGPSTGRLVHTSREPVPDGEVLVAGILRANDTANNSYENVLAPGLRYRASDGSYVWATVAAGNVIIYHYNGSADSELARAAITDAPSIAAAEVYYLAIRAEGDQVTAEWYGRTVPNMDRSNYNARARATTLTAAADQIASIGVDREAGPSMLRARGMLAGGIAELVRFEWRPYTFTDQRLPDTIPLRGLPGTAPALLTPAIGFPGGSGIPAAQAWGDHSFGLFAWRNRQGRANFALNGDGKRRGGWAAINGATFAEGFGQGPISGGAAGAPSDLLTSARVIASTVNTGSGGDLFTTRRRFKRGQPYTLECWFLATGAAGTSWTIQRLDTVASTGSTILSAVATAAVAVPWAKAVITFTPTADLDAVALRVTHAATGAGGRELLIAGYELYEGKPADAPLEREHTSGRGAAAPFGVLQAENTIDLVEAVSTTDAVELTNGQRLDFASNGSGTIRGAEYWIDPRLIVPADFAGDTIDVQFFAGVVLDANIAATGRISARHEADTEGTARVYSREFGTAGRALLSPAQGSKAAAVVLLGTLTLGTRGGRYVLRLDVGSGTVAGRIAGVDALVAVPIAAVTSSPTGKSFTGYPIFAPWQWSSTPITSTISHERRVEPDGSAQTLLTDGTSYPYGSLGGEPIELDPGPGAGELLAWTYPAAPGAIVSPNGIGGYTGKGPTVVVRCDVTPRYRLLPV